MSPADRRAVEAIYEAFNANRPELLDDALAPDWLDTPMAPGQGPGREGLKAMVAIFTHAFSDASFRLEDIVGSRGRVAVRLTLRGRHAGEWMGVPPTGRPFEIPMHEFYHLEDGRVTHTWHLEDWAGWREQVCGAPNDEH